MISYLLPNTVTKNPTVNNKILLKNLKVYRKNPIQKVPDNIAKDLYRICAKLAESRCFVWYPFKEDMVSDALYNCLKYLDNFNPDQSPYAHTYFSKIAFTSFLRYIKKEKIILNGKKEQFILKLEEYRMLAEATGDPHVSKEMYYEVIDASDDFIRNL